MRTFLFTDGRSNKFWNIALQGASFTVTFGKVGTKGQSQTKDFPDEAAARKAHDKLVAEKLGKGYTETTAGGTPSAAPSPLQNSLEEALVENPDDLAAYSAYADYLMEQGDPRGEFIQVQRSLEDARRTEKERSELRKREAALLQQHDKQWLGDIGRFLVGDWSGPDKPFHYAFARGWLDHVRVLPCPEAVLTALARSPEARLLRRLEVVYDMRYHPFEFDQFTDGPSRALRGDERKGAVYDGLPTLPFLLESPYLTNLRVFKLGFTDSGEHMGYSTMVDPFGDCTAVHAVELLTKCPRLDELYLNTHLPGIEALFATPKLGTLRVLQYYYGRDRDWNASGTAYPLAALAENRSMRRLTTLRLLVGRDATVVPADLDALLTSKNLPALIHFQLRRAELGDAGCELVVRSGILGRLETLDLSYGTMTDEGASQLAACPDLTHLKSLDVSQNVLTNAGVAALRATGVHVVADGQRDPDDEDDYLSDLDFE